MSRFSSADYEEMFPNQGELWWANVRRAIVGKRGQRDLRILERALLDLPEPRLVEGRIATKDGGVCAVGAYALQRRLDRGEPREKIIGELSTIVEALCSHGTCWHGENEHVDGVCQGCVSGNRRAKENGREPIFPERHDFVDSGDADGGDVETAELGKREGMTFALAWRIGQLNDEDFGGLTPEARYERVLQWVRDHIVEETVAA